MASSIAAPLRVQVMANATYAKTISIRMKELSTSVSIDITPEMTSLLEVIVRFHDVVFAKRFEVFGKKAQLFGVRAHPQTHVPVEVLLSSIEDLQDNEVVVYQACEEFRTLVEQGSVVPVIATRLSSDSSTGSLSPTFSPSMKRKGRCPSVANNAERIRRYAPLLETLDLSPRERGQIQTLLLDGDDQVVAAMEQLATSHNPAHIRRALQGRMKTSVEFLSQNFSTLEMHSPVPAAVEMTDDWMPENPFLMASSAMPLSPDANMSNAMAIDQESNPFLVAPTNKTPKSSGSSRGRTHGFGSASSGRPSLSFGNDSLSSPFVFLHSIREKTSPPNSQRSSLNMDSANSPQVFDERIMEMFSVQDLLENVPVRRDFFECYEVGKTLGSGRYSIVKECRQLATNRAFAVKIIDKRQTLETRFLKRELEIMHGLHHDGVVQLVELFESTNEIFVVMELCGQELFEYIDAKGPLDELVAQRLIGRLVKTVAYLHQKCIVHRDIKPENILLSGKELWDIKLSDFGIARKLDGANCTLTPHESLSEVANLHEQALDVHSNVRNRTGRAHTKCGTRDYVAPEVMSGKGYSTEADLWSVGVVTYVLLSGCAPVFLPAADGTKRLAFAEECWNDMSEEAKSFIEALLVRNPEQRITAIEALEHSWLQNAPL